MKAASTTLINYLAANSAFLMADLYQITLQSGTVYYWTEGDTNLTFNSQVYTAAVDQGGQPLLERGEIRTERGLKSSTTDITLYCGQSARLLGVPAQLAAHNGLFDNAEVLVTRVFMPTWGDTSTLGGCVMFDGTVASVGIGSTEVVLHVASWLQNLTVQMPRALFLPQCSNTFGDASCGLALSTLTLTGTVASGSTATSINGAPGSKPSQYWQNGVMTFTSGANAGTSASIASYTAGGPLGLVVPLPAVPSVGDAFSIYPGCSKTLAACQAYGNSNKFRGCPFVPPAESGL